MIEIIDIDEFAKRVNIPRKKVLKAISNGQLKAGVHYFLIEDQIRFQWCQRLIDNLYESTVTHSRGDRACMKPKTDGFKMGQHIHGRSAFDFNCIK